MQQIIILGGNNVPGQIMARHLLTSGLHVTVFADADDDLKISHHNYHYIKGDVFNIHSVTQAIAGYDAVVSVYSSYYLSRLLYLRDGLQNIILSMKENNISRFIFFNFSDDVYPSIRINIVATFFKKFLGIDYDKKIKLMNESSVIKSGLIYTINSLEQIFLRRGPDNRISDLMKKYYFFLADELLKQLLEDKDINKVVKLKFGNGLNDQVLSQAV